MKSDMIRAMRKRNESALQPMSIYVKSVRKALGLSQAAFAAKIGKGRDAVAKYENMRAIPPGDVLLKIMEIDPKKRICSRRK